MSYNAIRWRPQDVMPWFVRWWNRDICCWWFGWMRHVVEASLCGPLSIGTLVFRSFTKKWFEKNSIKTWLVLHNEELDNEFWETVGTYITFCSERLCVCLESCFTSVWWGELIHHQQGGDRCHDMVVWGEDYQDHWWYDGCFWVQYPIQGIEWRCVSSMVSRWTIIPLGWI